MIKVVRSKLEKFLKNKKIFCMESSLLCALLTLQCRKNCPVQADVVVSLAAFLGRICLHPSCYAVFCSTVVLSRSLLFLQSLADPTRLKSKAFSLERL